MSEPRWLSQLVVMALHNESLANYGGLPGLRDEGLLQSALARPRNKYAYGVTDVCELAAAYAFGLARNHPFGDGNKRVALLSIVAFLRMNGRGITADNTQTTAIIRALAAGDCNEAELCAWIREHSAPR